jgi:cell division protein FtsB
MTEKQADYDTKLATLESENSALKAQVAQLQAQIESAFSLIRTYEMGADMIRAAVPVFPRRIKQEVGHAGNN